MISIKKNPDIKLNIPKFNCDENAVADHLNNHPLTRHLNCYGLLVLIGRPASGKTSMAISLMTQSNPIIYKKTHHHNIIVMPTNSINSLAKNPFSKLPEENFYDVLDDDTITEIYRNVDEFSKEGEKTLLFIDDQTASLKSSKTIMETLKKMIYNRRHLKLNIIITAQSYSNIPLDIRKNIQNLVLFKPSKKEFEIVFEELLENRKDICLDVMRETYDEKHNFLFVNVPSQSMFKNWDDIIVTQV
jgi:hypothetical protein